ncbi:uncharacterized protein FIBRA_02907 [Fibroporia radiculosa]|uniref:Oxidase ustYa n=1 Tax=Fibroporia radiculosa TaxID=599839 RepID=J4I9B3_9APHY|nr:uncharacterized protein FIBRA_02907 [Fibroporia radiculosa]CCM00861.1 predicted protein [Fibroporia radiculosa]
MHDSSGTYYVLPAHVVHAGVLVLVVALLSNIAGLWLYVSRRPGVYPGEELSRLPLEVHPAALQISGSERYGLQDDADWASLFPAGGDGFIKIQRGDTQVYYGVAMYHQLHCLDGLRGAFNELAAGNRSRLDMHREHAAHCLGYLRQVALCSADITLESTYYEVLSDGTLDGPQTNGSGAVHRCGDWVQVRQFLEDDYQAWVNGA